MFFLLARPSDFDQENYFRELSLSAMVWLCFIIFHGMVDDTDASPGNGVESVDWHG
jgi:hypothetical protein